MRQRRINHTLFVRPRCNRIEDASVRSLLEVVYTHNVPVKYLAELIGIKPASIYRWFSGESRPRKIYHPRIAKVVEKYERAGWDQKNF